MSRTQISAIMSTLLFFVATFACVVATRGQVTPPEFTVSTLEYPSPGYFLIPTGLETLSLVDNAGKHVYKFKAGINTNIQVYENKWITHFTLSDRKPVFIRRDISFNVLDTLRASSPLITDFHECKVISDTSYMVLGTEQIVMDLSNVVTGGRVNARVIDNVIQIRTFSGNTIFEWRSLDHIPVTDATDNIDLTQASVDYIHINSMSIDTDGNILVSCRHLDEVLKIDRQDGSIIWRFGGSKSKNNQFAFSNDTLNGFVGFSHQHTAARTRAGTLLMFDNGTIKDTPRVSRAVEYELNETTKTARRVWQFVPDPAIFSGSMGSATELENGNVIIGWGSGSNTVVVHEVGRDGNPTVVIDNPRPGNIAPYRVGKTDILMTGVYKRLTQAGTVSFATTDSTTHLNLTLTGVTDTTSAVVERHAYAPHNVQFPIGPPCVVLPMRWVFRVENEGLVSGTMTFDLGAVPGVIFPSQIKLYHRPIEGNGEFALVATTYDISTQKMSVDRLLVGEYLIAYSSCYAPKLIEPADRATEVVSTPLLRWTNAVGVGDYQVELSPDKDFATVFSRFTTTRLDTTVGPIPDFTKLYWRVRTKLPSGFGAWSDVSSFVTRLSIPSIISPRVNESDTVAILPDHTFRWNAVTGASAYRIMITGVGATIATIDSIVSSNSFVDTRKLVPNSNYRWYVQALSDTIIGRVSTSEFFVTAPSSPRLISPSSDAIGVSTDQTSFDWTLVPGALRYVLAILRPMDSSVVFVDSVSEPPLVVPELPVGTRLTWMVHAVGRYGKGVDAVQSFTTTSTIVLSSPRAISPNRIWNVDTLNVPLTWSKVPDAKFYDIEVSSKASFASADIKRFSISDTTWSVPTLTAGTTYRWRAVAYNDNSSSGWSATATFTTKARLEQGLIPVSPMMGATNVSPSGSFSFTTSPKYSSYDVLAAKEADFETPDFVFVTTSGVAPYSGLQQGTQYFWRVKGRKPGSPDDLGPISSFETSVTSSVAGDESSDVPLIRAYFLDDVLVVELSKETRTPMEVSVFDVRSERVLQLTLLTGSVKSFDCSSLPHGVYYLLFTGPNEIASFYKVIK